MNIKFTNINQIPKFVKLTEKFVPDIDIVDGRYIIDAKSLNGVLSLGLYKDLEIYIHTLDEDIMESFNRIMSMFMEDIDESNMHIG